MPSTQKQRILLVEDEEDMRMALEPLLGAQFEVLSVGGVQEAIDLISGDKAIDLLLTDFNLNDPSKRDGLDIALAMRRKNTETPIALITGLSPEENARIRDLLAMPNTRFLAKPFTSATLREVLRFMQSHAPPRSAT